MAERAEGASLHYIFFGLRGDVTAAQYLYEMVERAFETETDAFRATDIYFEMVGERRSATNSFQTGLAQGISDKLHAMRAARDAVMRSASDRDLVPVKAVMVDEELEKLGLSLSRRVLSRGKRVLADAFEAGQAAGQRFEFSPAITQVAANRSRNPSGFDFYPGSFTFQCRKTWLLRPENIDQTAGCRARVKNQ